MSFEIFPGHNVGRGRVGHDTIVLVDTEGYSISEISHRCLIINKIERILENDGHVEQQVDFLAYVAENVLPKEVEDHFEGAGFLVMKQEPREDEVVKLNMMQVEVLLWGLTIKWRYDEANVLILSKNFKNIEQDPNFSEFRAKIESDGFHVVLSELRTFLDLDRGNPIL